MIVADVADLRFWPGDSRRPALDGVSIAFASGEITVVDGPSGSGKSTLLRALAGLVPHFHGGTFSGVVTVAERDTRTTPPAQLAAVVGSVFQDPETQAVRASVGADVAFGLENLGVPAAEIPGAVLGALRRAGVDHLQDRAIATLSGGERQRVAIAAAIAGRPRLLLLDEPTSQLDDRGVVELDAVLRSLAAAGTAIVIAEHHAHRFALRPDRVVTLVDGRLGAVTHFATPPRRSFAEGSEILRLERIAAGYGDHTVLQDCSLTLTAGTITALHGPNGAGKSTIARVIAGLHEPSAGTITLEGRDITAAPAHRRVPCIGFLPQDAGRRLVTERVDTEVGFVLGAHQGAAHETIDALLGELDLDQLAGSHPMDLSVGERERVALGAVLAAEPRVIVLDEPSRGMDPARRTSLAAALRRRASTGAAVLLITHDPAFAAAAADRHLELVEGRLLARDAVEVPA